MEKFSDCGCPHYPCQCDSSKATEPTVRPFSNGTQYSDWSDCNCSRCTKGVHRLNDDAAFPDCELEAALLVACFDSGEIPLTVAQRIGMEKNEGRYVWPCAEVDWTSEWRNEYIRRQKERNKLV